MIFVTFRKQNGFNIVRRKIGNLAQIYPGPDGTSDSVYKVIKDHNMSNDS